MTRLAAQPRRSSAPESRSHCLAAAIVAAALFFAALAFPLAPPARAQCGAPTPGPIYRYTIPVLSTPQPEVGPRALEQRWGIRILHLSSDAGGGLELRFQVIQARLASALAAHPGAVPLLEVQATGAVLAPLDPVADPLQEGGVYSLFYPDPGGAVRRGSPATLLIGGLRLPYLHVQ